MVGYQNPEHRQARRRWCCERGTCTLCDNAFSICIHQIHATDCYETGKIEENNDDLMFQEGDSIGRLTNPLVVSGIVSPVSGYYIGG